jgi:glycosyltransferase involved in cell wall biosynthesis
MSDDRRTRVVLHQRLPHEHNFSIERVVDAMRTNLPARFDVVVAEAPFTSKGVLARVRSIIDARRYVGDVHHVTGDTNYLGLLLDRRRTVLTVHDCEFLERASAPKRLLYRLFWLQLPVWRAAIVTIPTEGVGHDLRAALWRCPRDVRLVPNFVSDEFASDPRPLRSERPVLLQVGTRPNKNLERVAVALNGIGCRLVVVGPLTSEQRGLLSSSGVDVDERVDITDDEMVACYREADAVVFASTKEGFGLPVLEAQATGRPVITSLTSPLPEVAGGPAAACLVDPFDTASIRAGIERVLGDEQYRSALVEAGLRNVERYRVQPVADAFARIYDELADAAGRQRAGAPERPRTSE